MVDEGDQMLLDQVIEPPSLGILASNEMVDPGDAMLLDEVSEVPALGILASVEEEKKSEPAAKVGPIFKNLNSNLCLATIFGYFLTWD